MTDVIRDILDKQLIDGHGRRIGKVDGLVLEWRDDAPPRLAYIEVGAMTLGRRLHPRFERWAAALERWLGVGNGKPYRVPFAKVRETGLNIVVDLDVKRTPIQAWSRWVREHVVKRIPGA